jgi:SpoVK/Ycf46/Vps4 family AAA+-type ATPase
MFTQLPTSPDDLSLLEIQSALTAFRSLQAERRAKLREFGQRLRNLSDRAWQETATVLRKSDPEASDRLIADRGAAHARVATCVVAISITIGLFGHGILLGAAIGALFSWILISWAYRTWPWTTRLELFLTQTKPALQLILGTSETEVIAFGSTLEFNRRKLDNFKDVTGIGFTVNEQWALVIDLESGSICHWRAVGQFTPHRIRAIGDTISHLLSSENKIQEMARDCFFMTNLEKLIMEFETAQTEAVSFVEPDQALPRTGSQRVFNWSTKELEQGFSQIAIANELQNDLVRRLDRFVSGKMTGCPGLLLFGPPGSGKSSIARVLSKLGGLELFSVKLPDLKGASLGSGAQNVRQLWDKARQAQRNVLIFIDELDAIFPARSGTGSDAITIEIVAAFCAEWDGIEQREAKIFILGATNRPEGVDPAILSRFGTQKEVPLPDKEARKKILKVELAAAGLTEVIVPDSILGQTGGMSGRDLHKVVQELAVASHPRQPYFGDLVLTLDNWRKERSLERNDNATWDRLIVSKELKDTLQAYCRILKDYEEFKKQGVNIPRGVLLFGPSGTGKTQVARTLSCEGGLSFIGCTTSDIKQGWIGHSAHKMREIFTRARSQAPCILFIDELDIIAPTRGTYHDTITTEIVGELTQQLDGIRPDGPAVFVLAATNRVDAVDSAILSRFVERIEIGLPDTSARQQLLEVLLGGIASNGHVKDIAERLSALTPTYSGRDLQQMVSKAVLSAVKRSGGTGGSFKLEEWDFELLTITCRK